jgi:hypothetical protein
MKLRVHEPEGDYFPDYELQLTRKELKELAKTKQLTEDIHGAKVTVKVRW